MNPESTGSTRFYELLAWLELNKKQVAVGLLLVLLVGGGVFVYRWYAGERERSASAALLSLRSPGEPRNAEPPSVSEYQKIAQKYSGTEAAERAMLLAAGAAFSEGNYAEAQRQFEKLLTDFANAPWAAEAAYGLATSLEAQEKQDEAVSQYQKVVSQYPRETVAPQAKLALARIHESRQKLELAYQLYDELARATPGGSWSSEASTRRQQLVSKNPELAKTNPPAPSALTATNAAPATTPSTNESSSSPASTNDPTARTP